MDSQIADVLFMAAAGLAVAFLLWFLWKLIAESQRGRKTRSQITGE